MAFVVISFWLLLENAQVKDAWSVPVAMVCLSLAWNPAVQEQLIKSLKTDTEEPEPWKLTFYLSCLKIISTVAISLLLFFFLLFENQPTLADFKSGWSGLVKYTWTSSRDDIYFFTATIVGSAVGYLVAFIACTACMQIIAFSIPLVLATHVLIVLLVMSQSCDFLISTKDRGFVCEAQGTTLWLILTAAVCLLVYQFAPVSWYLIQTQNIVLQRESKIFWLPTYNSVLLEQWLILARRNSGKISTAEEKNCKIIMCTTMYREAVHEMSKLLESIQGITLAKKYGAMPFECHIFFDGGVAKSSSVEESLPSNFVLQLISLIEQILDLNVEKGCKEMTPYGLALKYKNRKVDLTIHMKDNEKVKNKKRWSQVMYMEYVNEMHTQDSANPDETYILTTDADVSFTSNSVEALLDLMTRDHTVGAVCARTHPLGTGGLFWYQTFEYAIGHWFQKAAEHVIGSVLCSPGCFSVYRCNAIREVLPDYSTDVNNAHDFLTKDMGEDRWLCTLLVQKGWRIEYCAAAENSTHCPDDFDEFYKQRRRWIASTIANMRLFIINWRTVIKSNAHISIVFCVYQMLLLMSTLIGPSSVILVVSGGLKYAWNVSSLTSLITQGLVCVGYTIMCLLTSSKTKLWVSKLLTGLYAIIMIGVVVGIVKAVVSDFGKDTSPNKDVNATTTLNPSIISPDIRFSTTTIYLGCMAALFLMTGLLHLHECVYLFHGLWYLLFLPSGYLILMLYSICNITDRDWGTRQERQSQQSQKPLWYLQLEKRFKSIFGCFFKEGTNQGYAQFDTVTNNSLTINEDTASTSNSDQIDDDNKLEDVRTRFKSRQQITMNQGTEFDFWKKLIQRCLKPRDRAAEEKKETHLEGTLVNLRNKWLAYFYLSNIVWLALIITLAYQGQLFSVFGSNPVGLIVLVLFSAVVAIQFLAMLVHRLITFTHFLARAPYTSTERNNPDGVQIG